MVNKHTFDVSCVTRHLVGVVQYLHGQCVRVVTHTEFTWNRRREIPVVTKLNCYIGSARVDAFSWHYWQRVGPTINQRSKGCGFEAY